MAGTNMSINITEMFESEKTLNDLFTLTSVPYKR